MLLVAFVFSCVNHSAQDKLVWSISHEETIISQ